jgi:hypothetical protein
MMAIAPRLMVLQVRIAGGRTIGAGLTVSDRVAETLIGAGWVESDTVTLMVVELALVAGIPEIVPVAAAMARPEGSPVAEKV